MGLARSFRYSSGIAMLVLSQSFLFGLAVLPALLFWNFVRASAGSIPFVGTYLAYVIIAMSLIPAYLIFSVTLMFSSAGFNRLMGWRTEAGEYPIYEYDWRVVKTGASSSGRATTAASASYASSAASRCA
jgi:hypothetical protein